MRECASSGRFRNFRYKKKWVWLKCVIARRWKWLKQADDKFQTLHTVRDVRCPKCCWNVSRRTHIFVFSRIIIPSWTWDNEHVSHTGSMCAHFHTRWHINWYIMPERDSSMTSRSWQLRVKTQALCWSCVWMCTQECDSGVWFLQRRTTYSFKGAHTCLWLWSSFYHIVSFISASCSHTYQLPESGECNLFCPQHSWFQLNTAECFCKTYVADEALLSSFSHLLPTIKTIPRAEEFRFSVFRFKHDFGFQP